MGKERSARDPRRLSTTARFALVQEIAARLAESRGLDEVVVAIRTALQAGLGVDGFVLNTVSDDRTQLLTLSVSGTSTRTQDHLRKPVPLEANIPASVVLASGSPIYWGSLQERDSAFPGYAGFPSQCQCWALLPLTVHGSTFGVLSIGWREQRRFDPAFSALLQLIAQQCAVAVDRAKIEEVERTERETLELMSEGTRLMVSDLNPEHVVQRLVHLAVPRLAPWCAVYVAEEAVLRRVAIEVAEHAGLAEQLRGLEAVPADSSTALALCYRTGEARVVPDASAQEVRVVYDETQTETMLPRDVHWTALVVPIRASGQTIGVMSLVSHLWDGAPPPSIWHAAEGLAGRAGVALRNARRFDVEHSTATLLTETLLPGALPAVAGYDVAARYVPAEGRVAGDWFDVFPLPSGSFLVAVGDVGGHGIRAATLMTQLRNAARGLALAGCGPARVVRGLAEFTVLDAAQGFATALYSALEPGTGVVRWSSAGHFPPLKFGGGAGAAAWLEFTDFPPFGITPERQPREHAFKLATGEGFLLVTDGILERRGVDLDRGLEQLRACVASSAAADMVTLVNEVIGTFCQAPRDDCCVVALRRL